METITESLWYSSYFTNTFTVLLDFQVNAYLKYLTGMNGWNNFYASASIFFCLVQAHNLVFIIRTDRFLVENVPEKFPVRNKNIYENICNILMRILSYSLDVSHTRSLNKIKSFQRRAFTIFTSWPKRIIQFLTIAG